MKELALAKSRLAAHLSQDQRARLVLDMLQHVVLTLNDSEIFEQVYVVSADPGVRQGHNPALQAAALTIIERAAWRHGAYSTWSRFHTQRMPTQDQSKQNASALLEDLGLLTISADLPLLTQADIYALIAQAEHAQIVLAGSSDSTGTNAILMRPPAVVPYLFGPNSLPAYVQAAKQRQVSYTLVENANLALDIDTIDDLRTLEQRSRAWSGMASLAI